MSSTTQTKKFVPKPTKVVTQIDEAAAFERWQLMSSLGVNQSDFDIFNCYVEIMKVSPDKSNITAAGFEQFKEYKKMQQSVSKKQQVETKKQLLPQKNPSEKEMLKRLMQKHITLLEKSLRDPQSADYTANKSLILILRVKMESL
jgi:hypothetical protein